MRLHATNKLMWFAVLGGPVAWLVQFAVNLYLTWAQCNSPVGRYQIPLHALQIGLSAGAVAVGVASMVVSAMLYRRTYKLDHTDVAAKEREGEGFDPPTGRVNFMAMVGLTVNFLSLAIVVMTAVGGPLLPVCQQS